MSPTINQGGRDETIWLTRCQFLLMVVYAIKEKNKQCKEIWSRFCAHTCLPDTRMIPYASAVRSSDILARSVKQKQHIPTSLICPELWIAEEAQQPEMWNTPYYFSALKLWRLQVKISSVQNSNSILMKRTVSKVDQGYDTRRLFLTNRSGYTV